MRLLDGLKVYHKVLASLSRQEPSRLCFVCFSRPLPFSHPRSASMPIHSAVCQEDRENGSHDKGISMEMDEVNSSFSRLSLSPSFDWPFFSFFFSRLLLSMTRVGSLISFPRTLSLFGLSLSLSHSRSFPLCHVLLSCSLISPASFFLTRFWKPKEGIENRNEDIRLRKMVGRRKV